MWLKGRRTFDGFLIVTRSANALLALMSSCSGKDPEPDKSLFYQTWIPVGHSRGASAKGNSSTSAEIAKEWTRSIRSVRSRA